MQNTSEFKKIFFFCEYSKKIGGGHLIRSNRLYLHFKNKYNCKFYKNCNRTKFTKLTNNKEKKIIFCDFKNYNNFKRFCNKYNFYIFLDNKKRILRNSLNINPLILNKGKYNGPNWFIYPKNFKKKNKKNNLNRKVNILISQGLTDANNNLNKITKYFLAHPEFKNFNLYVKVPKINYLSKKLRNYKNIHEVFGVDNINSFLNKFEMAISATGNLAFELGCLNVLTIFVSDEKEEIKRGKLLEKKGLGKFFLSNNKKQILEEINSFLSDNNYAIQIKNKQQKNFKITNLNNYDKLIKRIFYEKNKF